MSIKAYVYVITLMLSIFAYSGVDFDQIMRKNKPIEAPIRTSIEIKPAINSSA